MDKLLDVIVIGSGPSGLICGMTAVTGTPINSKPIFSGLILEKNTTGEFAKYGRLRITPYWAYSGRELIDYLKYETTVKLSLPIQENEPVLAVDFQDTYKVVKTTRDSYRCKKLAICCGFFPHGYLLQHPKYVRVIFTPMEYEAPYLPQEKGYSLILLGGNHGTAEMARQLTDLRPDLDITVVIDSETQPGGDAQAEQPGARQEAQRSHQQATYHGYLDILEEKENAVVVAIRQAKENDQPKTLKKLTARYILVNYDAYTRDTQTTSFLKGTGFQLKQGYIPADQNGNTGVPGVVAAGNIVTPVSGVLTALSSGFVAGLNLHKQLYEEAYNRTPLLFPWLPLGRWEDHPLCK